MNNSADQAVSPVVSVILVVVISVLLSATIGAFVLDLGQSTTDSANQQDLGVRTTADSGQVTVDIITGTTNTVELRINGTVEQTLTDVSPGDQLTAPATTDSTVEVVLITDDETQLVSTQNPLAQGTYTSVSDPTAPSDGLIAHWTMDDGDVSESTMEDAQGTFDGEIQGATPGQPGINGQAFEFNGAGDSVRIPHSGGLAGMDGLTISLWVKSDDWSGNHFMMRMRPHTYHFRKYSSQNEFGLGVTDANGNSHFAEINSDPPTGKWVHLVGTYNDTHTKLYINGTLVAETAGGASIKSSTTDIYLGKNDDYGEYYDGLMDEVRIYNRSITEQEVADSYNAAN